MEFVEPEKIAAAQSDLCDAPFGALKCRATAHVKVASLVKSLTLACLMRNVRIRLSHKALTWSSREGVISRVITDMESVDVDAVLVTAGAWTSTLPDMQQLPQIRPVRGQGIALPMPVTPSGDPLLKTIVKRGPIYLVPAAEDGEILVGSTTEPEAGFDEAPTEDAREYLRAKAVEIFPALQGRAMLRQWAGLRPQAMGKGHPPIMSRHPQIRNLFVCAGHYKTGIGMAPLASQLMTEMILGTA
jgi:glycine oxidase